MTPGTKTGGDTGRLRVTILIRVSENEADLSVEGQTRRQLRLHATREPPQESLTVGRIILREPVEINRIGESGCRAKGMGPQKCRVNIVIGSCVGSVNETVFAVRRPRNRINDGPLRESLQR